MTNHASGPFDVRITAQDDKPDEPLLNRMTLDKQYHGDLEGTGKGQMLTAGTDVKGSGAYVAIERVYWHPERSHPAPSFCSIPAR